MSNNQKQPFLRAPISVIVLCVLFLGVHFVATQLSGADRNMFYVYGALFPARFFEVGLGGLPGGTLHGVLSLLSYSFLHGSWEHVVLNTGWIFAFGTVVARRIGGLGFVLLFFGSAAIGGFAQAYATADNAYLIPIVGASAGGAGLMGAACRFAFSPRHKYAVWPEFPKPLTTIETLRQPITLVFILVWFGLNFLSGLLAPLGLMTADGSAVNIAWVAHIFGFISGFYLLSLLDPPPMSASGGPGRVDYGDWRD
ncbi:rhomboid family intramembrane serine protease [Alphaproteobacteria bacterium]|nr:rhomboid family intramembrane serine protease [Alphaproteobacteria bacterium]